MALDLGDKKWIKNAIAVGVIKGVVEGINQVMIPYSEDQEKRFKVELKKVDESINRLDVKLTNQIGKLERKLDAVTDNQADKLDNHEKRIGKLELASL